MKELFDGDFRTDSFHFQVNEEECIHCHRCIRTCSSAILYEDEDGTIKMEEDADGIAGWAGCYRCQHCLAVCPKGAITIMGKKPENSLPPSLCASPIQLEALMRNRRSCRNYLDKEISREEIDAMLRILGNVETGSNRQSLEFSVTYQKEQTDRFRKILRRESDRLAEQGVYPGCFSKREYEEQLRLEPVRNPGDMYLVNAPHILIIHSDPDIGQYTVDPVIAASWFDLICASRGYGAIIMTFPVGALSHLPEVKELLGIPKDRFYNMIIGFGYPSIPYARGVQREGIMKTREIRIDADVSDEEQ